MSVYTTLFLLPLIISNNIMKSTNELELSDTESNTSKPKAPRKLPTSNDRSVDKLDKKYLLLSKQSIPDIKKAYLPRYNKLGCLLKEKENMNCEKTNNIINKDNTLQSHDDNKQDKSNEIQVTLTKQTHVNNYFKASKVRKLGDIEKSLDEKIRPSSKKRKINKINFNYK
jgi:hypothetical protein